LALPDLRLLRGGDSTVLLHELSPIQPGEGGGGGERGCEQRDGRQGFHDRSPKSKNALSKLGTSPSYQHHIDATRLRHLIAVIT
jgi:hypothetical protein